MSKGWEVEVGMNWGAGGTTSSTVTFLHLVLQPSHFLFLLF